jgi:hypothetical protein
MPLGNPPEDPQGSIADELKRLGSLGPIEPSLVGPSEDRRTTADLIAGHCTIFGRPHQLIDPVDWAQDPHDSRSWRYELHSFTWMRPLLTAYAGNDDGAALAKARDLLLDWASAHLEPSGEVSEFTWYDMAVGLRAPYYAYVLRQSLNDHGPREDDALLLQAAKRHGVELAHEENYCAGHNHGLFQDEGLYILATQLPTLPDADEWRELALRRLQTTLAETIDIAEGVHLEHSSAYQFTISNLVARLADNIDDLPELAQLRDRLRETGTWHVTPSGNLAQLGDSDDVAAPRWAREAASGHHGMKAFHRGGQAFVRDGDSYLAVSAAHHSNAHKHGDDCGFILVEGGHTILADAGRWGYYEKEPDRLYARSARAHNVLVVDDADFDWRKGTPYGSGLLSACYEAGWYFIAAHNPLLEQQGVFHTRLFQYRPGVILLITDALVSSEHHVYTRHFHFGQALTVERTTARGCRLKAADFSVRYVDLTATPTVAFPSPSDTPPYGWLYPADRSRVPCATAVVRSTGSTAHLTAAFLLG